MCPNTSCRRTFTRPLKTVAVGVSTKPFYACPYCLTKLSDDILAKAPSKPASTPKPLTEAAEEPQEALQAAPAAACSRGFGYLSNRGSNPIPDDCYTCKDIVQCMFQKTKESVRS